MGVETSSNRKKTAILLTNDDGYHSLGIQSLAAELEKSHAVCIVAPQSQQSGISHAFTCRTPLQYSYLSQHHFSNGTDVYTVAGTPADCVKFGLSQLLDRQPDIIVSGINEGDNAGIASFYSGTVAAAREAAFYHLTAVAYSIHMQGWQFQHEYAPVAAAMTGRFLSHAHGGPHSPGTFYNVNFPARHLSDCCGVKVTRQSCGFYQDTYRKVTLNDGSDGFLLEGVKARNETTYEYDVWALDQGYITITPLQFDATAYSALSAMSALEKDFDDMRRLYE
ncbi:MAG: 5'/3'-nucleotidase SurE [Chitinivibrionales bacterium]|nr:5'/3'-nucleotidase SurE [Chitinivibrionales bacterium]